VVPLDRNVLGREGLRLGLDLKGGIYLVYQADVTAIEPENRDEIMDGVKGVIERRVNALGITEPIIEIRKQGEEYNIAVSLPGVSETEQAKEMVGRVSLLEFREQDAAGNWTPATGTVNNETLTLTSRYFRQNTDVVIDQYGQPLLVFEWDETGAQLSEQITTRLYQKQLAIFLGDEPLRGEDGHIIAPVVQAVIEDQGQIEGLSLADATQLKDLLNAGRIPVPLGRWVEEEGSSVFEPNIPYLEGTTRPTLGAENIERSILAAEIGIVLLLLFMILYYRLPGLVACLSLGIYGVMLLAIFKLWPVTLTLPGIAGFILSIGMAVDANVLIFERMKDELRGGRSLGAAVEAGFSRAWTAIRDSNITTFIACIVLIWLGTTPTLSAPMVSGFAVTLLIGVALSMFTAITVTRTFLRLIVGSQIIANPAAYGMGSVQTMGNAK